MNLDGKKLDLLQLKQALETNSMFTSSRLVIIEGLFENKRLPEFIEYLKENPSENDLVLWEGKELSKSLLSKFPQARVLFFKPEQVLFRFLESIRPGNTKEMLTLFGRCLKSEAVEIIFYMLIRQIRLLLLVRDGIMSGIDAIDRLAPWQKQKLTHQANYFTLEQLTTLYHHLLEIDYEQKSGLAVFDLTKALELFITNL